MLAEAALTFLFHPNTDTWTTEVQLSVDVEVIDSDCRGAGQVVDRCDGLSSSTANSCALLIYVADHHVLRRVFLEEKTENKTDVSEDNFAYAANDSLSSPGAKHAVPGNGHVSSRRTEVRCYHWQPCDPSNGPEVVVNPLTKFFYNYSHTTRGEEAVAGSRPRRATGKVFDETGAVTPSHPHVFSSGGSGTSAFVGVFGDDDDDNGDEDGGRLVLCFDSSSPSSSPSSAPRVGSVEESDQHPVFTDVKEEVHDGTATGATRRDVGLPVHFETTTASPIRDTSTAVSSNTALSETGLKSGNAPRRVLLLCPGTGGASGTPAASTSGAVQPSACSSSVPSGSARGGRVLNVNSTVLAKAGDTSSVSAREKPDVLITAPCPTSKAVVAEVSSIIPSVVETVPPTNCVLTSGNLDNRKCREWQPCLLSFAYPEFSTGAAPATQQRHTHPFASAAIAGRHSVTVHLEFESIAFDEATSTSSVASAGLQCSRRNVASCGWSLRHPPVHYGSSKTVAWDAVHRASHGYAVIIGDSSREACSWMCPLVAAVLPCDDGRPGDAKSPSHMISGTQEVRAGPLLDVWVRTVVGRQLLARRGSYCDTHNLPFLLKKSALTEPPQPEQGAVEGAAPPADECSRKVAPTSSRAPEQSRVFFTAVFSASWLSQLYCVFTPCGAAAAHNQHLHAGRVTKPRLVRRSLWPSSLSSSLVWEATQVAQDCIVTRLRCATKSASPQLLSSGEVRRNVKYCWLRCDPHQGDTLHRYLLRVFACWTSAARSPFSESSCHLFASTCGGSDNATTPSVLDIIVTKANPPSLSLRGGAVGTASAVLMSAETLHTAALEVKDGDVVPFVDTTGLPVSAGEARRLSPSALRARVAITAAILEHLMLVSAEGAYPEYKREASRTEGVVQKVKCESGHGASRQQQPPRGQKTTRSEGNTSRLVSCARTLAVYWIFGSPSLLRNAPMHLMDFFSEERALLSSVSSLRRVLDSVGNRIPSRLEGCEAVNTSSTPRLDMLHNYASQYASASHAALAWLSHHATDAHFLRQEGFASLRLREAEHTLLRDARVSSVLSLDDMQLQQYCSSPGEGQGLGAGSGSEESRQCASLGDGASPTEIPMLQLPLRGKVKVHIEHAVTMNAFMVRLEWTTMVSSAVCVASLPASLTEPHTTVELPFFLLVFVVDRNGIGLPHDSGDSWSTSDDDDDVPVASRGVGGHAVRLHQVTPFSWRLGGKKCTQPGFSACTTQLLMHSLDLVARRPDAFEEFKIQTPTGLASDERAATAGRARAGKAFRHTRGGRRGIECARESAEMRASGTAVSRAGGARSRSAAVRSRGARLRAAKRRRRGVSGKDVSIDDTETSSENEGVGSDAEEDNDADIFTLDLGLGRGPSSAATTARSRDRGFANRRRPGRVSHRGSEDISLSVVDTARIIPVVVFHEDAAAPLLEVEVCQATQLATQLALLGSSAPNNANEAHDACDGAKGEASRVLCALLDHWIGFSSLHAVTPYCISTLQLLERQSFLVSIAQRGGMSARTGALADRGVLQAYVKLLRSLWRDLAHAFHASSRSKTANFSSTSLLLTRLVPAAVIRAHFLDPASVATAVRAAMSEYLRQDVECRRRLMLAKRDASAQWDWKGAEEDSKKAGCAPNTGGTRKGRLTGQAQRLLEEEEAMEAAARATWAPLSEEIHELVSGFYTEVLQEFPPGLSLSNSGANSRSMNVDAQKALLCETPRDRKVSPGSWNHWDLVASEKCAAFQTCLQRLLHPPDAAAEGSLLQRLVDTSAPATSSPAVRLQLGRCTITKFSASEASQPRFSELSQSCMSCAGGAEDLDVTVTKFAEACVAQLAHTIFHSRSRVTGAATPIVWTGGKTLDQRDTLSVRGDSPASRLAAQLLRLGDTFLLPCTKSVSDSSAECYITAARFSLPLVQLLLLVMSEEVDFP